MGGDFCGGVGNCAWYRSAFMGVLSFSSRVRLLHGAFHGQHLVGLPTVLFSCRLDRPHSDDSSGCAYIHILRAILVRFASNALLSRPAALPELKPDVQAHQSRCPAQPWMP